MAGPLDDVSDYGLDYPHGGVDAAQGVQGANGLRAPVATAPSRDAIDQQQQRLVSQIPYQNRWGRRNLEAQIQGLNLQRRSLDRAESQQQQQNKFKAADLAERGIPTFRNASGGVSEVTDEVGAPLTHLDKSNNIAYDSQGQPRSINYDSDQLGSPPRLDDPFANATPVTDEKTGDVYQKAKGLPWKWLGKDPQVEQANLQAEKDKAIKGESALIGQRLSIDHADYVAGEKEHNAMTKELIGAVPSLQDPRFAGADRDTILKGIEDHFNTEYGSPAANEKNGWFSKELSPDAAKLRADIDNRKAAAMDLANNLYDLKDRQVELGDRVQTEQQQRRDQIDTLLAHSRGELGPLDGQLEQGNIDVTKQPAVQNPDGSISTVHSFSVNIGGKEVLLPTVTPDGQVLTKSQAVQRYQQTGQHLGIFGSVQAANDYAQQLHESEQQRIFSPQGVTQMAQSGQLPPDQAPAAVAAAHDAQDAQQKADALKDTDPTLADQFKGVAQGLLGGLTSVVGTALKGAANPANPINWLTNPVPTFNRYFTGNAAPGEQWAINKLAETSKNAVDDKLKDTFGAKAGEFVGSVVPYVALALATRGESAISTPALAGLGYQSGWQARYDDAIAHGVSPEQASILAQPSGVINGLLLSFPGTKAVRGMAQEIFGGSSPKIIKEAIEQTFQREGAEGVGKMLDNLANVVRSGEKPVIKGVAQDVRQQVVDAVDSIKSEILKTPAQRALDVAKHMGLAGAAGAGAQVAENIISKTYDPNRGLFEGVPEQALGFGLLAGASEGFRQIVAARRAKQALDLIAQRHGPALPPEGGIPEPPPVPPQPNTPPPTQGAEPKQAKARVVEPTTEGEQNVPSQTEPTKGQVSQPAPEQPARGGGAPEQPKLPAPQPTAPAKPATATATTGTKEGAETGPVPAALKPVADKLVELEKSGVTGSQGNIQAQDIIGRALVKGWDNITTLGTKRQEAARAALTKAGWSGTVKELVDAHKAAVETVDEAAHKAATSPTNEKPQPTTAQQQAGNYAKGPVQIGPEGNKLNVSIENPAGSQRSNLDTGKLNELANAAVKKTGTDFFGRAQDAVEAGDYQKARERIQAVADHLHLTAARGGNYAGLKDLAKQADSLLQGTFSSQMTGAHYGYIKGTVGADKDHVDAFIKEGTPSNYDGPVFVIDRTKPNGTFDEHKVIIGAKTHEEALAVNHANYDSAHREMYSGVTKFDNMADFKKWLKSGAKGPAAESKGVALAKPEHPINKQIAAAFEKHADALAALGHPSVPKITTRTGNVGANIFFHPESGIIHVNPEGLAENTKNLSEHARQRYIDRAVDEEIKHLATHKWAKASPENAQQIVKIGNEKDGVAKILSENYKNWDKLNAAAKGYEKIRFVLQDRKPTEIAAQFGGRTLGPTLRDALRKIFKFINDLPGTISPALKQATDAIRDILKGKEVEPPVRETSPKPASTPKEQVGKTRPRFTDPHGKTHTLYGYGIDVKISPTGEGGKYHAHGSGWEWYAFSPVKGDIVDGFVHGFEDEWGSFSLKELKDAGVRFTTDPQILAGVAPPVGWKTAEGKTSVPVSGKKPMGQPPGISSKEPPPTEFEKRRIQRVDLTERVGKLATAGNLPAKDQMVLRTLLQYGPKKEPSQLQLDQAGRILDRLEGPEKGSAQWNADLQKAYQQQKAALTRAINAKDWSKVIQLVDAFEAYYEDKGVSVPDNWARWQRAKEDAHIQLRRQNAERPSNAQVEGGKTKVGGAERPSGEGPKTGGGHNVVGETEGGRPRGGVPRTEEEKSKAVEPAGRSDEVRNVEPTEPGGSEFEALRSELESATGETYSDEAVQAHVDAAGGWPSEQESERVAGINEGGPEGANDIPVGSEVNVSVKGKPMKGMLMESAGIKWVDVKGETPLMLKDLEAISVSRTADQVKAERDKNKYGEPAYPQPKTRDQYETTLWNLAADISERTGDVAERKPYDAEYVKRTMQMEAQFNRMADQIELSQSKRRYMMSQAANKRAGRELRRAPTLNGNMTVYNAPKPQDFDPSKEVRSKRWPRPMLDYMTKAEVESSLAAAREQLANKKTTKNGRRQAENIVREREQQLRLGNYLEAAQEREKARGVKGVETAPKEPKPPSSGLSADTEKDLRDAFEGLGATVVHPALTIRAPAIKLSNGEIFESDEFPMSHSQAASRALAERGAFAVTVGGYTRGYVTQNGKFLTEDQAHKLARISSSLDLDEAKRFALGATSIVGTLEQKPLPPDKLPAFITLAQKLASEGVDTPQKLARAIDTVIGEKGRPYAQAMWDALGMIKPELRGTHDWKQEFNTYILGQQQQQQERDDTAIDSELESAFDKANENGTHPITEFVKARLLDGKAMPRTELTKLAERLGEETKEADELAERGVVLAVREVAQGTTPETEKIVFDQITRIYENQPNLTAKTATSKLGQAYSTPAPLAFVASRLADVSGGKSVYEPTAGNGMLLIEAKPEQKVYANELDQGRAGFLQDQAKNTHWVVTTADATKHEPDNLVDRLIENPPFGRVADEEGQKKSWPLFEKGTTTKQIDHAIATNSLEALQSNGRAVLVIGGFNAVDPIAREKAYAANPFYQQLYEHYKVIDHFTVDGDLYKKQGAGWPVDMIVITGIGKSPIRLPSAKAPRIVSSWKALRDELGRTDDERIKAGQLTESEAAHIVSTALGEIESVTKSGARSGQPRNRPPTERGAGREPSGGQSAHPATTESGVSERGGPEGSEPATGTPAGGSATGPADVEHEQRGQLGVEGEPYPEPAQAQYRIPYKPKSKHSSFGIFIPKNLEDPVRQALERVATEVGDIDKYVREKLGYKPNEKFEKFFSAEQVDGLALMIFAAENGSAGVIGDQGGVGKGRMAAGMMLYAIQKGWIPVFLTRDPKLYAAMMEDLDDIGRGNLVPFFTNNAMRFKDHRDKVWRTKDQTPVVKEVAETGELPTGTHVLFSSYFQIQSDVPANYFQQTDAKQRRSLKASGEPPPDGPKMEMFKKIAPKALFIMDESHMAAGDSIRAWRLNPLLASAPAAYYSSATFAKRPDSMGIYFRTSLNRAAPTMEELVSALSDGGVPLQQAVIAMLSEDGLYIRRERDFSNTDYHTHILGIDENGERTEAADRDLELADAYTSGLRKILGLSNDIAKIASSMNAVIKNSMRSQQIGRARAPRLEATNFAALIHNMVSHYLFAIKARGTVERALHHIGEGRRVVIAFQNTMQSAIEALKSGGYEMSFKGLLKRYMDGQRVLTSGRGANKQTITIKETPEPEFENVSDDMLKRMLLRFETDAEGQRVPVVNEAAAGEYFRRQANFLFVQVGAFLEDLELGDMPLSPIDYIHNGLRDAGIRTVEITGRKTGLDRDGKTPIDIKGNSKAQQVEYMKQFNNGNAQALLMNGSGSTGISLHASEKFKNQEQRALLVIQPHLDINEFMQTTWRVDRTGQVVGPVIEVIQTAIPAELRPAAVLERKMGSLNANTTSNAKNEMKEQDTDIFNEFGDEVVHQYLASDPYFVEMLGWPKIMRDAKDDEEPQLKTLEEVRDSMEDGQLVAGVTGRLAILPTAEGDEFWRQVTANYKTLMKYLDQTGQNTLTVAAIDMKAETLGKRELTSGNPQGDSAFDGPSIMEHVRGQVGKEPRPGTDVLEKADEAQREQPQIFAQWNEAATAWERKEHARRMQNEIRNLSPKEEQEALAQLSVPEGATIPDDVTKQRALELYVEEHKLDAWIQRTRDARDQIANAIGLIGETVHIHNDRGLEAYGAVESAKLDLEAPLTPSKQEFTVWVNTTQRQIHLSAPQLNKDATTTQRDNFVAAYEDTAERSNERYIITGNLLAGSVAITGQVQGTRVITFTDNNGRLRQGILMPVKFNPATFIGRQQVQDAAHAQQLLDDGRTLMSKNQALTIVKRTSGVYELRVPASGTGKPVWGDYVLRQWMDKQNFVQKGSSMVGQFPASLLTYAYNRITQTKDQAGGLEIPLFFNKPVEDQPETLGATAVPGFARDYWSEDVKPKLANAKATLKEVVDAAVHTLSPTYGVNKDVVDQIHKLLGERNQVAYIVDRTGEAFQKMFDSMSRPDLITFIDRMKLGEDQPTPELAEAARFIRKVDDESWDAMAEAAKEAGVKNPVKWLANHYRVMWKKIPKAGDTRGGAPGAARSPLRGSRGMAKQHTYDTMSEGIEDGGEPYSYNPIVNEKMALADIWKYATALKLWAWGKKNHFAEFVRGPFPKLPSGMVWLNDSIADVWFPAESGEGLVHAGRYAVEEGFGRILNNFLSRDHVRATRTGRTLMWIKNFTTQLELALSLFHGMFEGAEVVGSNIGLGLSKMYNRGMLKGDMSAFMQGMADIIKSPISPVTVATLGAKFRDMAGRPDEFWATPEGRAFLQVNPDAREIIGYLFAGGHKPIEIEADWKNQSIRTFTEALQGLKSGDSKNYIGAGLRAFPAASEFLMKPLFDVFIPNLKIGQFVNEMREALRQNDLKYPNGYYIDRQGRRHERPTNAELARKIWRLVEDRFGELNYDTLFWNQTFKAAMQLLFRSVTWKLGSVEAFAGAFGGQGKEFINAFKERRAPELHRNMAWLFGIFLLTAALGTVISVALGKHKPKNPTDLVFPRIDPDDPRVRVSLPTYFKDLVHLVHSPTGYVKASLAGWIGRVAELLSNKDYYGVQIRNADDDATKQALQMGAYTAQAMLPFSIRGYKNLSSSQENTIRKMLVVLGINSAPRYIGQTPAEQKVEEFWKGQRSEEGIKPEQFEAQKAKRELVSKIRKGKNPNISGALAAGSIKPRDVPYLYKRAQMGPLAAGIDKMPLEDAEKVYAKASPEERAQLAGIIARKRANSQRRQGKTMYAGF